MRIANQTVLPATQLAETNVVVDVETLVIRCQAAQRSRRSRELTDQAEAEYQRRSAGQRMRRRRELQEADALRIGARTSQRLGMLEMYCRKIFTAPMINQHTSRRKFTGQINCTTSRKMVAYLRKQSPGRSTLAGTSLWESLYGSVQRIGGATSADGRKHRITIAMLSEKRVNPEIEAGDPLTVLAQITHFRDDWCTMCCRECWQELKNERGLERCRHCFRYVQPIPRLRLTMTVTESQGELWWRHC